MSQKASTDSSRLVLSVNEEQQQVDSADRAWQLALFPDSLLPLALHILSAGANRDSSEPTDLPQNATPEPLKIFSKVRCTGTSLVHWMITWQFARNLENWILSLLQSAYTGYVRVYILPSNTHLFGGISKRLYTYSMYVYIHPYYTYIGMELMYSPLCLVCYSFVLLNVSCYALHNPYHSLYS